MTTPKVFFISMVLSVLSASCFGETIQIAVASNFINTMRQLANNFEKQSRHKIVLSAGSSAGLFAKIKNGAPYNAYFSADTVKPKKLVEQGLARRETYIIYAKGKLALWAKNETSFDDAIENLSDNCSDSVAIANPRLAPYGEAAKNILNSDPCEQRKFIMGENINQVFQFAHSGAVNYAFIAYSHVISKRLPTGKSWMIPNEYHPPINQAAVVVSSGNIIIDNASKEFIDYVQSDNAKKIIQDHGYAIP